MNQTTIIGNLTRDPELRYTGGGKAVVGFGVAVNRRYQVSGDWKEDVTYYNVTVWDTYGENVAASLSKGDRVFVTGRLDLREYEAKDGTMKMAVDIVASEVGPVLRWATVEVKRTPRNDGAPAGDSLDAAVRSAQGASPVTSPF